MFVVTLNQINNHIYFRVPKNDTETDEGSSRHVAVETQDNEADISRKMPAQSGDSVQGSEKVGLETTTTPLTTTTTTTMTSSTTTNTTTTTTTTGVEAEQEFREETSVEKENIKDTVDEAESNNNNITETRISEDDEQGGDTGTSPVVSGPAPRFGARHRGRGGTRRVQACTSS